jgi:hypothetical protein
LAREGVEQAATQGGVKVLKGGLSLGQLAQNSLGNLQLNGVRSLVVKEGAVLITETAAREALNQAVDSFADFCFDYGKPKIMQTLEGMMCEMFSQNDSLGLIVRKMFALDSITGSQANRAKIEQMIFEIINPENGFWQRIFHPFVRNVIGPVLKGALGDKKYLGDKFTLAMRFWSNICGTYDLITMIGYLKQELRKRFVRADKENFAITNLLVKHCQVKREQVADLIQFLQHHQIFDADYQLRSDVQVANHLRKVDFGKLAKYKDQVITFLDTLNEESKGVKLDDLSMVMRSIANAVAEQMIGTAESHLISPWSSYAVSSLVKTLSEKIQSRWVVDRKQSAVDYPALTVEGQILGCAQSAMVATKQDEVQAAIKTPSDGHAQTCSKDVQDLAEKILNGEPADLAIMHALALNNNLNLIIDVDSNYQLSEEDKKQGKQLVRFLRGQEDPVTKQEQIGHYQLIDHNGNVFELANDSNDCGYAIFSKLTGKSVAELRHEMAQMVVNEPANFERALAAEEWLAARYPDERNSLTLRAGAISALTAADIMMNYDESSQNPELNAIVGTMFGNAIDKAFGLEADLAITGVGMCGDVVSTVADNCVSRANTLSDKTPGERIMKEHLVETAENLRALSVCMKFPEKVKGYAVEEGVQAISFMSNALWQASKTAGMERGKTTMLDEKARQAACRIMGNFFVNLGTSFVAKMSESGQLMAKTEQADEYARHQAWYIVGKGIQSVAHSVVNDGTKAAKNGLQRIAAGQKMSAQVDLADAQAERDAWKIVWGDIGNFWNKAAQDFRKEFPTYQLNVLGGNSQVMSNMFSFFKHDTTETKPQTAGQKTTMAAQNNFFASSPTGDGHLKLLPDLALVAALQKQEGYTFTIEQFPKVPSIWDHVRVEVTKHQPTLSWSVAYSDPGSIVLDNGQAVCLRKPSIKPGYDRDLKYGVREIDGVNVYYCEAQSGIRGHVVQIEILFPEELRGITSSKNEKKHCWRSRNRCFEEIVNNNKARIEAVRGKYNFLTSSEYGDAMMKKMGR